MARQRKKYRCEKHSIMSRLACSPLVWSMEQEPQDNVVKGAFHLYRSHSCTVVQCLIKDTFPFIWEPHFLTPLGFKPLHRSTCNFEWPITLVRFLNVLNLVGIHQLDLFAHLWKIQAFATFFVDFLLFAFSSSRVQVEQLNNSDTLNHNRRGLNQRGAFLGMIKKTFLYGVLFLHKIFKRHFQC